MSVLREICDWPGLGCDRCYVTTWTMPLSPASLTFSHSDIENIWYKNLIKLPWHIITFRDNHTPLSRENNLTMSWESVLCITNALSHHQEKVKSHFAGSLAQWPTSESWHNGDSALDHRHNSPIQAHDPSVNNSVCNITMGTSTW